MQTVKYTFDVAPRNRFGEYRVRAYQNGVRYSDADYLTSDRNDAQATAVYENFGRPRINGRFELATVTDISDPKSR